MTAINRRLPLTALLLAILVGCAAPTVLPPAAPAGSEQSHAAGSAASPSTLTVFAAASLGEALEEIGPMFEAQNDGVKVEFNFAGSQQLARQINAGAPADVFAAANMQQMDGVTAEGAVDPDAVRIFAENRLVIIVPADNPGQLENAAALGKPGLKVIIAGEEVPVGSYTRQFLTNAAADPRFEPDYPAKVLGNVVSFEENVRAVLTKVQLGESDAGIVYATDARSASGEVQTIEIPTELNVTARYPVAAVTGSRNAEMAQRFVDFLREPDAQAVLLRLGFSLPAE